MTPELSLLISFAVFLWICYRKLYPFCIRQLDEYIDCIKKNLDNAETLKNDAYSQLKKAYVRKDDVDGIIEANRLKSPKKLQRLQDEHERLLQLLRQKHSTSVKIQLNAELSKQKNRLIERLADVVLAQLSEYVQNPSCRVITSIDPDDLQKLT
jgi:F0F1-type ATP synthase membrane subunit b/b'